MRALLSLLSLLVLAASCTQTPTLLSNARKLELLRALQRELGDSVANEKAAVLASSDDESERFAAACRHASTEVERLRQAVRVQASGAELPLLDGFDAAWARLVEIDARLLPLAVSNSNRKARPTPWRRCWTN